MFQSVNEANKMDNQQFVHSDKTGGNISEGSRGSHRGSLTASHDRNNEIEEGTKTDHPEPHEEHMQKFEADAPEEPLPDYPDDSNVKQGEAEKVTQLEESNVSSNSVTKVTASVALLKQEKEMPPHPYQPEKFERSEKKDKSGVSDIFKLSAGEARSRLVSRKKDPRRDVQMTLQERYQLLSNM